MAEITKARERLASELGALIEHLKSLEYEKATKTSVEDRLDAALHEIAAYEQELARQNKELREQNKALDFASRKLTSSEQKAKAVLQAVSDGIITIDGSGLIQQVNRGTSLIFGYDAAEMVGRNVKMLMPDSYAREHDRYLENYHRSQVPQIIGKPRVVQGRRKDGSLFDMNLTVQPVDLPGLVLYTGIVRDLSVHTAEVEPLLIGALMDKMDEPWALFDGADKLIHCNPAYRCLLGDRSDVVQVGTARDALLGALAKVCDDGPVVEQTAIGDFTLDQLKVTKANP